MERPMTAAGSN